MIPIHPTDDTLPRLPPRARDAHKGDFGRALLIGGSRGMGGAIALAAIATARSGAGLVKSAVPKSSLDVVARFEASLMTTPLPEDDEGRIGLGAREALEPLIAASDCLACGPGLGRSDTLTELVLHLYTTVKQPIVFDADALNALATKPEVLLSPGGPRILTPHPGEFSRLSNIPAAKRELQRETAIELAAKAGIVIVLKGQHSLITDGSRAVENTTGNPGMATGGSGDVLTGVILGLLAQKLPPLDAAQLGAYVHGRAGDFAAMRLGEISLIASDIVRRLPIAFQEVTQLGDDTPF